jgi:TonB family protein
MSAAEQTPFIALAEREFIAASAANSSGKLILSNIKFLAGKEFDDASEEVKSSIDPSKAQVVQASMPFAVFPVKPSSTASADALAAEAQKISGIDAADLRLAAVPGASVHMVCFSKAAIAERMKQVSVLGIASAKLYCRGVDAVAALQGAVASGAVDKPVLYIDLLPGSSRILVVSGDLIHFVGALDTGTDAILEQVMAALGLKFPGSAAKLFYGDLYDFDEHAAKLVAVLSDKLKGRLSAGLAGLPAPAYLCVGGLPSSRNALLSGKIADAAGLKALAAPVPMEAPDAPAYLQAASYATARLLQATSSDPWMIDLAQNAPETAAVFASLPKAQAHAPAPAPAPAPAKSAAPAPEKPVLKAETPKAEAPKAEAPKSAPAPVKSAPAPVKSAPVPAKAAPAPVKAVPAPAPVKPAPKAEAPKSAAPKAASTGSNKTLLYVGIGAAALVAVVIIAFVMFSGGKKQPAPKSAPAPVVTAPEPKAPEPVPETPAAPAPAAPVETPAPAPVVEEVPPAPVNGNISVQTSPVDAEVSIDGQVKGLSPVMVYDIPAGTYTVEIHKKGFKSVSRQVEVVAGRTTSLEDVALAVDTGSVTVATSPEGVTYVITPVSEGAGVEDASVLKGRTPATVDGLKPGSYSIGFRREGWKDYSASFEVKSGETSATAFEYKPSKLTVTTVPEGATVSAAGRELGKTPLELGDVAEGVLDLSVQLDGFEPEGGAVTVPFGGEVSRSYKLLPLNRIITRATELDVLPSHEGGATVSVPARLIAGFSGKVLIRFVIDQGGRVEDAELVAGSGLSDAAALSIIDAVRGWVFNPARRKGFPMRVEVVIPVEISGQ